jgi:FkbM family methyltransferase
MNLYFKETDFGHFCLLEKDLISNTINNYGYWELHLYHFYSHFIKPEDTIIDGGANLGFHSIQFAKLANKGTVYCFEPQPLIYNILTTNILINGATDIIKQNKLGLGEKENIELKMTPLSEQEFSEHCINYGGRGLTDSNEGEETVILTTIDNLNLNKLNLIKLDVQGFELQTLKGGENTIKSNYPIMFIENYPDSEQDKKVIDLIKEWGYEVYRLQVSHNEDCIAVHPDKHQNEIVYIESQQQISWKK